MFEKIVTLGPAFHKVHDEPTKNYGVGGVTLRMVLRGPLGATQFYMLTDWYLPVTLAWWKMRGLDRGRDRGPTPADRGYHWSTPQYEGHEARDCDLLPGGKCYYDGSGLNADSTYQMLLEKGDSGVWADLEEYYNELASRHEAAA
jgi:hypothetical protein